MSVLIFNVSGLGEKILVEIKNVKFSVKFFDYDVEEAKKFVDKAATDNAIKFVSSNGTKSFLTLVLNHCRRNTRRRHNS